MNASSTKAQLHPATRRRPHDLVAGRGTTLLVALGFGLVGCSGDPGDPYDSYSGGAGGGTGMPGGSGGIATSGGSIGAGTGGIISAGGASFGGMATSGGAASGGAAPGGSSSGGASGGNASGGAAGGAAKGGAGGAAAGGSNSGGTASGGTSSGGAAGGGGKATSGGTSSGGAAGGGGKGGTAGSGGASTGGAAGNTGTGGAVCTGAIPAPPANVKETIDITWKEMTGGFNGMKGARDNSRRIQTYKSWALDHVMWSQGNLNFCVRWDSTVTVTPTMRDQIGTTLQRGVDAWFSALYGYDCFPYPKVNVKVTGWAVQNRATLGWTDDALVPIYVNQMADDGAPTCPATCSRFAHQDKNYTFSTCPGGAQNRFDQFVWLEQNFTMPNGWDMGSHVNQADFTATIAGTGLYHIWLHEFGHGVGFPDYYDWDVWAPSIAAPACVMNAGAAFTVTDWDKWMFKRTWSELQRMNRWP